VLLEGAFFGTLVLGAFGDVRSRRIPNVLVGGMLVFAFLGGVLGTSPAGSVGAALLGALCGLALWLPFWLLGMLGAGDVKFYAAGAAWLGPSLGWRAALLAALLGGALGVLIAARERGVSGTAALVSAQVMHPGAFIASADVTSIEDAARTFPYAVPMAAALAVAAITPSTLLSWLGGLP
jgi:prepilin peptidase CpaA